MCDKRTSNINDLIRFSTKATLTIPTFLLDDEVTDSSEAYNDFRIALYCLKNDDGLFVNEKELDEELSEITIEIRED